MERLEGQQLGWAIASIQNFYRCIFHNLSTFKMRVNMARYPRVLMESCCKVAGCLSDVPGIASRTIILVYNTAHDGFRNLSFQRRQCCLHFPHCEYHWNFSPFEFFGQLVACFSPVLQDERDILLLHLLTRFSAVDNSFTRQRPTIGC